jgi:hypothetical protein
LDGGAATSACLILRGVASANCDDLVRIVTNTLRPRQDGGLHRRARR